MRQPTSDYTYPPEPLPPAPEHEGGDWWKWLLAMILIAGLAIAGVLLLVPKKVEVANVVGAQQSAAEIRLHRDGFKTQANAQKSPRAAGVVIGQDPGSGARAKKGSTVTLTVSSGPGRAAVPSVDDLGRRAARKQLLAAGFKVKETARPDPTVGKNHVITTNPGNGEVIDVGTTVEVFVSTGPEQVQVPDVTKQNVDDATTTLEDAGFVVRTKEQESADEQPGTVLAQDPAGGVQPKGARITLTVAKETSELAVPDVTGQTRDTAVEQLSGDFKLRTVEQQVATPDEDGLVLDQDPKGGKKAKRGSRVTITVGKFTPNLSPDGTTTTPGPGTGTPVPPAGTQTQ